MARTKEQAIVFQNQSHLVQRHFDNCGICPELFDIALATDLMVDWAIDGYSKALKERFDNMENYLQSKYKHKEITGLK